VAAINSDQSFPALIARDRSFTTSLSFRVLIFVWNWAEWRETIGTGLTRSEKVPRNRSTDSGFISAIARFRLRAFSARAASDTVVQINDSLECE